MASIEKFEDIKAWQGARELTNLVYDVTAKGDFSHDFELRNQIRSEAGSIMHNIAEGFESGSDLEFNRFLRFSRRSASEVQSELYLALDRKYITKEQFQVMYDHALGVKRMINAFIAYLKK